MDPLEPRRLMSVSIQPDGALLVAGTAKDDRVVLSLNPLSGRVVAKVNSQTTEPSDPFDRIVIDTRRGNDVVAVSNAGGSLPYPITIWTHAGRDTIVGGDGAERIYAGDDDDLVAGGDGRDTIYGGPGPGNDYLRGNGGSDYIAGEDGADTIDGDAGNDHLLGGANPDRLRGSAGNDLLEGGGGRDILTGDDGDDSLSGNISDDFLSGGNGNDTLRGDLGNDQASGDAGDDDVNGGIGLDVLSGGAGLDTFHTTSVGNFDPEQPDLNLDDDAELVDVPAVPTGLTAQFVGGSVGTLTWTYSHEDVTEFQIQRSVDGGKTWAENFVTEDGAQRDGEINDLDDGLTHVFRIRAKAYGSVSAFSPISNAITVPPLSAANLSGSWSGDSILLSWSDFSTGESGFQLFMREGNAGPFSRIASIAANPDDSDMTRAVRHLDTAKSYSFFVRTLFTDSPSIDTDVTTVEARTPQVNLGASQESIPADSTFQLTVGAYGIDPHSVHWSIDWGDGSPIEDVPIGASLARSHFYEGGEFLRGFLIEVTAPDVNFYLYGTKSLTVGPRT